MSSIQDIGLIVSQIGKEARKQEISFRDLSKHIDNMQKSILSHLDGTVRKELSEILSAFSIAQKELNNAILSYQVLIDASEGWISKSIIPPPEQSFGQEMGNHNEKSIWMPPKHSATNSYERAQLSKEESNVFLRQTSNLSGSFINMFPAERSEAIASSYSKASELIVQKINSFACNIVSISESGYSYNSFGQRVKNGSWYNPASKMIAMNELMNDAEYTDVLKHELGHFVDHMMGTPSASSDFIASVDEDANAFDPSSETGRLNTCDMLDDLFSTGACFDRNVTDIISALLRNSDIVEQRFVKERTTGYVANYMHETGYWDKTDANGHSYHMREKEIFANSFAIATDGYRISQDFIQRWFPNVSSCFDRIMTEA